MPADSRGAQNFCASEDRCRNHDTLGFCADSTLSECSLLRPLNGGDCKLPTNLLALFGSPAATSSGVHYGASAICVGLPNERLSRPGGATYQINEVLRLYFHFHRSFVGGCACRRTMNHCSTWTLYCALCAKNFCGGYTSTIVRNCCNKLRSFYGTTTTALPCCKHLHLRALEFRWLSVILCALCPSAPSCFSPACEQGTCVQVGFGAPPFPSFSGVLFKILKIKNFKFQNSS